MSVSKLLFSLILALAVLFAQAGGVRAAAPQQEDAFITGSIQTVEFEPDSESDLPNVVITLLESGEMQIVHVSLETAIGLELIVLDEGGNPVFDKKGNPTVNDSMFGSEVKINPAVILSDETATEQKQQPVVSKVEEFFSGSQDGDYELVIGSPSNGFGLGMIAQALWMTQKLHLDPTFFQTILDAKTSGDYRLVSLPDGTIPQNWGQLKKAVLQGEEEKNPGDVVSDGNNKPDDPGGNGQGNTHENPPGLSKDKDDDHGWRKDKPETPPGQAKDKDINGNGNNPITPPGQDKEKDKGKDKDKENGGNGKPKE